MVESGFDNFNRDYYAKNVIDNNTWEQRKVYDTKPFLVLPSLKFNIRLNNLLPNFSCFIRAYAEQFGDPIAFLLSGYSVIFYLYDNQSNLVLRESAIISNLNLGEIVYEWKSLDIQKEGTYYCEVELINTSNNKSFRLPDSSTRVEIIVTK